MEENASATATYAPDASLVVRSVERRDVVALLDEVTALMQEIQQRPYRSLVSPALTIICRTLAVLRAGVRTGLEPDWADVETLLAERAAVIEERVAAGLPGPGAGARALKPALRELKRVRAALRRSLFLWATGKFERGDPECGVGGTHCGGC